MTHQPSWSSWRWEFTIKPKVGFHIDRYYPGRWAVQFMWFELNQFPNDRNPPLGGLPA